ncbi:MAG: T9SS type A sorting domain-containing protein [Saprospiraceae bacterium]|nr:T9SS type A sorting domain-containing protein [Saprospiraceae bacterium]
MTLKIKLSLLLFLSLFMYSVGTSVMGTGLIDLDNLENYANQTIPNYITKDNTTTQNNITDAEATLGRVLFYDKQLSVDGSISCSSCHQQEFAFGDTARLSIGVNGITGRHSMRLVNSRFADEVKFFWDERAATLEEQTTMPIQDHAEMGFSGSNGDPDLDSLIRRMQKISYYNDLFNYVYGDSLVTENRIQLALAQFIRSMQSFDSKYDIGREQVNNENTNFPNFTAQENLGKQLFLNPPQAGGAGCNGCHRAPEFDIDPQSLNNGIITSADGSGPDLTNTRSPSLRDLVNPSGMLNGSLMHNGNLNSIAAVINHYNTLPPTSNNINLDPRLNGPGGQQLQNLQLTQNERNALEAFLLTLTGSDLYTNEKWADPFDSNGDLTIVGLDNTTSVEELEEEANFVIFPNPASQQIFIQGIEQNQYIEVFDMNGRLVLTQEASSNTALNIMDLQNGLYILRLSNPSTQQVYTHKIIKQ